jgi:subtilisin family serine protease
MGKTLTPFCIAIFYLSVTAAAQIPVKIDRPIDIPGFVGYVEDEFIIVIKENAGTLNLQATSTGLIRTGNAVLDALAQKFQVKRLQKQFPTPKKNDPAGPTRKKLARYYKIKFDLGDLTEVMQAYRDHPLVEHVEPIGIHTLHVEANDPYYHISPDPQFPYDQWHYWSGNSINTNLAWNVETGDPNVVVGVLDSGIRYFHLDLGGPNPPWGPANPAANGNIWINPAEIPANALDDDGNGFIDDTIGWDFVSTTEGAGVTCIDRDCGGVDNDPDDGDGHGTHVAGTIAAITNNARMVAGIAGGFSAAATTSPGNGVKVMALRIGFHARYKGQTTGLVRMDWAAEAMNYIADQIDRNGVNVAAINCSWGSSNTGGIDAAVNNLLAHDVMIIHAAGNSNSSTPDYLGSKTGVMNVAATDINGAGAAFSNYGAWVDLAAPGVEILSTYTDPDDPDPTHHYISIMDGTSMAAPHACGVAALLESFDPNLTGPQKFNLMVNNTTPYSDTRDLGSGILNANNALLALGPPDPPANVTAQAQPQCDTVLLSWTASATAAGYRIHYNENSPGPPFDPCQPGDPNSNSDVGNVTQVTISGLTPLSNYFFAVTAYSPLGQSDFSLQDSAAPGSLCTIIISGHVLTFNGNPIQTVDITANNGGGSAITDPNGFYQLVVPLGWTTGAVTPAKNRWDFDPNRLDFPGPLMLNQPAQNITGRAPADFNLDNIVNVLDLYFFSLHWLHIDCQNSNACAGTDLDLSHKVDLIDYTLFSQRWLKIR